MPPVSPDLAPRRRGRPPANERDGDLRTAAIVAARTLLFGGSNALSMEGIARVLGVRTPSLYHHFPGGRDEMVLAVADHHSRMDGVAIEVIMAEPGSDREKLVKVARHFATTANIHPYHILTEQRKTLKPDAHSELQRLFAERVEAPLTRLIVNGQREGTFRKIDPQLCVRIFLSLLLRQDEFEVDERQQAILPEFIVDIVVHGMGEPVAGPACPPRGGPESGR